MKKSVGENKARFRLEDTDFWGGGAKKRIRKQHGEEKSIALATGKKGAG